MQLKKKLDKQKSQRVASPRLPKTFAANQNRRIEQNSTRVAYDKRRSTQK